MCFAEFAIREPLISPFFFQMTEKEMQHLFLSLVYYLAFYFTYLVFYIISKLAFMSNEFSYVKWQERGGRGGC